MTKVIFIMSTGRCSTQFLGKLLATGNQNTLVVHEGAGPNYKPALVFRQNNFEDIIAHTHQLRDQFSRIERQLAGNGSFIETGWPAYAWGPYLEKHFGDAFGFIHLLRNPFATAASMSSHALLGDGDDVLSKSCVIRPSQNNIYFPEFRDSYDDFSIFERGLYHWLEVHKFLTEQHDSPHFMGLFRFEEMYEGAQTTVKKLWEKCGFDPVDYRQLPPFDRFNLPARHGYGMANKKLLALVRELAFQLGYGTALLEKWSNVDFLDQHYGKYRVERPRMPVQ